MAEAYEAATIKPGSLPCSGRTPLFYSYERDDRERAKALCDQCDFRLECLLRAIRNREHNGVWAGVVFDDANTHPKKLRRILRQELERYGLSVA